MKVADLEYSRYVIFFVMFLNLCLKVRFWYHYLKHSQFHVHFEGDFLLGYDAV